MNGKNTLTRVSNPANPQDVATKDYVDSNTGLLYENGGYIMMEYLNMGFNKIKNLGDPTEPSEATNKKYVDDSGRAIVQQHDGSFSAIANIDMQGYQLMNLLDPAEPQDVATNYYVDNANRAFAYGPGGYMATTDVSMGGRRREKLGKYFVENDEYNLLLSIGGFIGVQFMIPIESIDDMPVYELDIGRKDNAVSLEKEITYEKFNELISLAKNRTTKQNVRKLSRKYDTITIFQSGRVLFSGVHKKYQDPLIKWFLNIMFKIKDKIIIEEPPVCSLKDYLRPSYKK